MTADTLTIAGLSAECRLGVTEQERLRAQTVRIDLELSIDAAKAASRDDVRDAVDYAQLVGYVRGLAEERERRLIETLAEQIAAGVLKRFGPAEVQVRVAKRALPGIDHAAVSIRRTRGRIRKGTRR